MTKALSICQQFGHMMIYDAHLIVFGKFYLKLNGNPNQCALFWNVRMG